MIYLLIFFPLQANIKINKSISQPLAFISYLLPVYPQVFNMTPLKSPLSCYKLQKLLLLFFLFLKYVAFYDNFYSRESLMKIFPSMAHTPKVIWKGRSFLKVDIQSQK